MRNKKTNNDHAPVSLAEKDPSRQNSGRKLYLESEVSPLGHLPLTRKQKIFVIFT